MAEATPSTSWITTILLKDMEGLSGNDYIFNERENLKYTKMKISKASIRNFVMRGNRINFNFYSYSLGCGVSAPARRCRRVLRINCF